MERLEEEVARCRRGGAPLSVVLGELDAPHVPAGEADRLAGWMAEAVADCKRRGDVAGHYGRRGFLMLLPQTTAAQALGACRRLGRILAEPPSEAGAGAVHARLALTEAHGEGVSVPGLLRRAEERLQRAHEQGLAVVAD
jgi:GGDEF domain-containing protein